MLSECVFERTPFFREIKPLKNKKGKRGRHDDPRSATPANKRDSHMARHTCSPVPCCCLKSQNPMPLPFRKGIPQGRGVNQRSLGYKGGKDTAQYQGFNGQSVRVHCAVAHGHVMGKKMGRRMSFLENLTKPTKREGEEGQESCVFCVLECAYGCCSCVCQKVGGGWQQLNISCRVSGRCG